MRALVVLATSEEADNIDQALARVREAMPDADVLVVDDSSADGTAVAARAASERLGRIRVVELPRGRGLAAAYRAGFTEARGKGYDAVATLDADLSHDAADLPRLFGALRDGIDLVIGSRWVEGGSLDVQWPIHRRLLSRWGNRYAAWALGLPVRDLTSGFRVYRTSATAGFDDEGFSARGYAVLIEQVSRLAAEGGITEVPIVFAERQLGASKMTAAHVFESMARVSSWGARRVARRHRDVLIVLGVMALASALVVPTLAPVAVSDDWLYARVVEMLVHDHRLVLPDLTAASLVAQAVWGGLFTTVFGFSLGVLRLSTVVMAMLGGAALYGIGLELSIPRDRAALLTAAFVFNPVAYMLAHTFMTDSHFTSWMLLSTWAFLRGLRTDRPGVIVSGSVLASVAVLVRPHGVLVPLAIVALLLVADREPARERATRVLQVAAVPVLVLAGYYAVLAMANGVPDAQRNFVAEIRLGGAAAVLQLLWRLPYIEVTVVGLALLPVAGALLGRPRRFRHHWSSYLLAGAAAAVMVTAFVVFIQEGRLVPYATHFASADGIGPGDLHGTRAALLSRPVQWTLSIAAVTLGVAWLTVTVHSAGGKLRRRAGRLPSAWTVVAAILVGQVLGTFPVSVGFLAFGNMITLDRYLLPVVPLALVLFIAAMDRIPLRMPLAWAGVALMALFSIASARDYLVYESAVWSAAQVVVDKGEPITSIDGGVSWDGWHTSDGSRFVHTPQTPDPAWWIDLFAPAIDSTYVVANSPIPGHRIVGTVGYSAWLRRSPQRLFVLQRLPEAGRCAPSPVVARRCRVVYP